MLFSGTFSVSAAQIRLLSSNKQAVVKVDKSLLSKLRKETGFGFAKCMESLQLNNNDYNTSVSWLEAEAEKQGWEKATKLQGRPASEGLVGVLVDVNHAAMVEVGTIKACPMGVHHSYGGMVVWPCLFKG